MKFLKHENFPDGIANLIRHFEYWCQGEVTLQFPQEIYGQDVTPGEWLLVIGNQGQAHRPTILTIDSGTKENAVSTQALKGTKCSFVILARKWQKEPLQSFAWKIIKAWPEIVRVASVAHSSKRQCRIDVSLNGNVIVRNL